MLREFYLRRESLDSLGDRKSLAIASSPRRDGSEKRKSECGHKMGGDQAGAWQIAGTKSQRIEIAMPLNPVVRASGAGEVDRFLKKSACTALPLVCDCRNAPVLRLDTLFRISP